MEENQFKELCNQLIIGMDEPVDELETEYIEYNFYDLYKEQRAIYDGISRKQKEILEMMRSK